MRSPLKGPRETLADYAKAALVGVLIGSLLWLVWNSLVSRAEGGLAEQIASLGMVAGVTTGLSCLAAFILNRTLLRP